MKTILTVATLACAGILWGAPLRAQATYEFSTVVELQDGLAAGEARLVGAGGDRVGTTAVLRPDGRPDGRVAFALMAPGGIVDWIEIRDAERGGEVLATTRPQDRRAPRLGVLGLGELLNDPRDGSVGIGIDVVVELELHVQDDGRIGQMDEAFVVVGFEGGETAAFPILTENLARGGAEGRIAISGQEESGAMITMEMPEEPGAMVTVAPSADDAMTAASQGDETTRVAVGRTTAPARPSQPPVGPGPPPPIQPAGRGPQPPVPPGPGPQPPVRPLGPGPQPPTQPAGQQGPAAGGIAGSDWNAAATALRGRTGQRFVFQCPPGGTAGRGPWGGAVYTDHSSVCTAAVHAGLITFASGGSVTIEIRAGQDFYAASPGQGGVTSSAAGGWPGSYAFVR